MSVASHEALHNAIRSRFETLIASAESLPTQYDNEGEEPPDDALYCRFTVLTGESEQRDIGGGAAAGERIPGMAIASLFWPTERGTKTPHVMADKIAAAFRRVSADGVTYRTPTIRNLGRTEGSWQINVEIPFYADKPS